MARSLDRWIGELVDRWISISVDRWIGFTLINVESLSDEFFGSISPDSKANTRIL